MKNLWLMFVTGLVAVFALTSVLDNSHAVRGAQAAEVHRAEGGESMSALRNNVPLTEEVEVGINARKKELDEREARIKEASERLAVEEERVKSKIEELEKIQAELAASQKKGTDDDAAAHARVVKTFESMSPKKASAVISTMEDTLVIELLSAMKEKKVAAIMDAMEPSRAMTLSTLMAKRKPASAATAAGSTEK